VGLFLLFEKAFEASDAGLQVTVDCKVPGYDTLHLVDVFFDVLLLGADALRLCDELSFLIQEFRGLADVLDMFEPKLIFFFKKTVNFFVESEQIVVDLVGSVGALAKAKGHSQVVHFLFVVLGTHQNIGILLVLRLLLHHHLGLLDGRFSWLFLEAIFRARSFTLIVVWRFLLGRL
jgi:hypothetical protein